MTDQQDVVDQLREWLSECERELAEASADYEESRDVLVKQAEDFAARAEAAEPLCDEIDEALMGYRMLGESLSEAVVRLRAQLVAAKEDAASWRRVAEGLQTQLAAAEARLAAVAREVEAGERQLGTFGWFQRIRAALTAPVERDITDQDVYDAQDARRFVDGVDTYAVRAKP